MSTPFVLSVIYRKKKRWIYDISNATQNWGVFRFFVLAELRILLGICGETIPLLNLPPGSYVLRIYGETIPLLNPPPGS